MVTRNEPQKIRPFSRFAHSPFGCEYSQNSPTVHFDATQTPSPSLSPLVHPAPALPLMTRVCKAVMSEFPCFPEKEGSHYRRLYSSSRLWKPRKIRLLSSHFIVLWSAVVVCFWRARNYFSCVYTQGLNGYLQEIFHSVGSMQEEEGANWVNELPGPVSLSKNYPFQLEWAYCSSLTRDLWAVEHKCTHFMELMWSVKLVARSLCSFVSLLVYLNNSVLV